MKKPKPWNKKKESAPEIGAIPSEKDHAIEIDTPYWKSWIALITIVIATLTEFYIVWWLLFLFWVAVSIKNKELFLVEKVSAQEAPITFWTIVASWLLVSFYTLWEFLQPI
ncbi:MAG: hypothetical protein MI867_07960 [Pseudomonadales bacterium]|nr:hypothetical protein [Pseudomonadales bacterium]